MTASRAQSLETAESPCPHVGGAGGAGGAGGGRGGVDGGGGRGGGSRGLSKCKQNPEPLEPAT